MGMLCMKACFQGTCMSQAMNTGNQWSSLAVNRPNFCFPKLAILDPFLNLFQRFLVKFQWAPLWRHACWQASGMRWWPPLFTRCPVPSPNLLKFSGTLSYPHHPDIFVWCFYSAVKERPICCYGYNFPFSRHQNCTEEQNNTGGILNNLHWSLPEFCVMSCLNLIFQRHWSPVSWQRLSFIWANNSFSRKHPSGWFAPGKFLVKTINFPNFRKEKLFFLMFANS